MCSRLLFFGGSNDMICQRRFCGFLLKIRLDIGETDALIFQSFDLFFSTSKRCKWRLLTTHLLASFTIFALSVYGEDKKTCKKSTQLLKGCVLLNA